MILLVMVFSAIADTAALEKPAIKRFEAPKYSILAVHNGIQGTVKVRAVIGADGLVTKITAISGPELLRENVIDAVKQWSFVSQGTSTELTIGVEFVLRGKAVNCP